MSTTIPPRIQSQAARKQYAGRRMFGQPIPIDPGPALAASAPPAEVAEIKATIFNARDRHVALLEDAPAFDRFVRQQMAKTGAPSYGATVDDVLATVIEVRNLAVQFESPLTDDAEVARVALAKAKASNSDSLTFAQVLRGGQHV